MIELVFVACLAGAPQTCREHSLLYVDITPTVCLMGAQAELAKWANTHANQTITNWKCRRVIVGERKT